MNTALRTYVTQVAFHMSLSGGMVDLLDQIRLSSHLNRCGYYTGARFVPLARSLINRGLVVHDDSDQRRYPYRLTRAGELMCGILEEAGMIPTLEQQTGAAA